MKNRPLFKKPNGFLKNPKKPIVIMIMIMIMIVIVVMIMRVRMRVRMRMRMRMSLSPHGSAVSLLLRSLPNQSRGNSVFEGRTAILKKMGKPRISR